MTTETVPMGRSTLITTLPQIDGGVREVHAQDARHARRGREILRRDRAMVDHLNGVDGIRTRVRDR